MFVPVVRVRRGAPTFAKASADKYLRPYFNNLDSGVPALCAGLRNDVFVCFMFGNTILKRKN